MNEKSGVKIDVVGDVHGHYQELLKLLEKLGYSRKGNIFRHSDNRCLGFVGDFINRGPDSVKVLNLVKSLHQEGLAVAVLGNHEFRLIQDSVSGKKVPSEYEPFLPWLRTLPLFIELERIRIVHAVWHFSSIERLKKTMVSDDAFIEETMKKKSPFGEAVKRIVSGMKIKIPPDLKLVDRFGIQRSKGRLKWWMDLRGKSFTESFLSPMEPEVHERGPNDEQLTMLEPYDKLEKPVFFGHYCLPPNIPKVSGQTVCLDGCVTCDKTLWAYRYEGTHTLSPLNLVEAKVNNA